MQFSSCKYGDDDSDDELEMSKLLMMFGILSNDLVW